MGLKLKLLRGPHEHW